MSVNKVILLGRLGKDPELRYTQSQTPVCSFSLATGDRRKDASGNWVEQTEWHNIVTYGKTAELCNTYLKKGRQAFIEGKIQTRKWQDKEGRDRYTTEVIGNTVQFIGGKNEGAGDSGGSYTNDSSAAAAVISSLQTADSINAGGDVSFDDDDIPF
jgi:single-strand DNA-binding protein